MGAAVTWIREVMVPPHPFLGHFVMSEVIWEITDFLKISPWIEHSKVFVASLVIRGGGAVGAAPKRPEDISAGSRGGSGISGAELAVVRPLISSAVACSCGSGSSAGISRLC